MRLITYLVLLTSLIIASCNSPKSGADVDKSIMPEGYDPNAKVEAVVNNPEQPTTVNSSNNNTTVVPNSNVSQNQPIQAQQMQMPQMQNIAPINKNNNAVAVAGLNPAHGQPGHRCDIPEGSPLSSAPTASLNAPQSITPTVNTPAKTITAAGMNPAHGEPGHRCDISVGAPLNSPAPAVNSENKQPVPPVKAFTSPAKETDPKKSDQ